MKKPVVLCILDGCGIAPNGPYNAFKNANTPTIDYLEENYPSTILDASGEAVGLPKGQMGNSEVGHMNIGAGRIVYQSLKMIDNSIENGDFFSNKNILEIFKHVKNNNSKLHLLGLISDGGVHSSLSHAMALIKMCKDYHIKDVCFHLFTDGRDTDIHSARNYIKVLQDEIDKDNIGKISTISGRYFAMDRDNRYDRVQKAYDAICYGIGNKFSNYEDLLDDQYKKNITDEFITPSSINGGKISDGDGIIVWNFRPDRLRELFTAITNPNESPLKTTTFSNIKFLSMMPICESVKGMYAFEHQKVNDGLGEYLSKLGMSQLRIAETEKYQHVTHFFDGDKDIELNLKKQILIPSPKVATFDLKPEMSAFEITQTLLNELDKDYLDFVVLNYANGDMVGHTGNYNAAIKAVETVDSCLKNLFNKINEIDGILIVTADHGNCEVMLNDDGTVCTTHTTNPVPFIVTKKDIRLKSHGKLADIAPTILDLMDLPLLTIMSGESLIKK